MSPEVKIGSLMVVHFVEQQLQGWEFERAHWPLHITLVPWFTVADEEAAIRSLERISSKTSPMTLHVGDIENFGVRQDVPVNIIDNQEQVKAVHDTLIETLTETDTAYDKQGFIGQKFMAHITRHSMDDRHSNDGEKILVTDYHLVRLLDAKMCRVERQFDLAGVA